jgi:hypothetical protein
MMFLDQLVASKTITLEGPGVESVWVRAVVVGITVRALMNLTLFNVTNSVGTTPVGVSILVQLYEPMLLESLQTAVWNDTRQFLNPYAKAVNFGAAQAAIAANLPSTLSKERKAALLSEIALKNPSVLEALEDYFGAVGRNTFTATFTATDN